MAAKPKKVKGSTPKYKDGLYRKGLRHYRVKVSQLYSDCYPCCWVYLVDSPSASTTLVQFEDQLGVLLDGAVWVAD